MTAAKDTLVRLIASTDLSGYTPVGKHLNWVNDLADRILTQFHEPAVAAAAVPAADIAGRLTELLAAVEELPNRVGSASERSRPAPAVKERFDYESLPLPGAPFIHEETYVYYEGRQCFAMRSRDLADAIYIVNTVDESDDSLTALAVALNADHFALIRNGAIALRDVFTRAGQRTLSEVTWTFTSDGTPVATVEPVDAEQIPDHWLPVAGATLKRPTLTAPPVAVECARCGTWLWADSAANTADNPAMDVCDKCSFTLGFDAAMDTVNGVLEQQLTDLWDDYSDVDHPDYQLVSTVSNAVSREANVARELYTKGATDDQAV